MQSKTKGPSLEGKREMDKKTGICENEKGYEKKEVHSPFDPSCTPDGM